MRTKDEKKILLAKVMVNVKVDPLYEIIEELWTHEGLEAGDLSDEDAKLPENRPIVVDNLLNTEILECVQDIINSYSRLKMFKGLLDE